MRKFGTDAPEFFTFLVGDSDKVYKIPLAASMPMKVLLNMGGSFESQVEMLRIYMGDAVDDLTASTLSDILKAWSDESRGVGASVGESEALSD